MAAWTNPAEVPSAMTARFEYSTSSTALEMTWVPMRLYNLIKSSDVRGADLDLEASRLGGAGLELEARGGGCFELGLEGRPAGSGGGETGGLGG